MSFSAIPLAHPNHGARTAADKQAEKPAHPNLAGQKLHDIFKLFSQQTANAA